MFKRILFFSFCLVFSFSYSMAQEEDITLLLDTITKQLKTHSEIDWAYKRTTKNSDMDEQWKPKKNHDHHGYC